MSEKKEKPKPPSMRELKRTLDDLIERYDGKFEALEAHLVKTHAKFTKLETQVQKHTKKLVEFLEKGSENENKGNGSQPALTVDTLNELEELIQRRM